MYLGLDPDQDEKFEAVLRPETLVVDCGWTFALRGTVYAYTLTRTAVPTLSAPLSGPCPELWHRRWWEDGSLMKAPTAACHTCLSPIVVGGNGGQMSCRGGKLLAKVCWFKCLVFGHLSAAVSRLAAGTVLRSSVMATLACPLTPVS
jgi:hypothetical protein